MSFEYGDKIRVKVSREDWKEFFDQAGIVSESRKDQIISEAKLRRNSHTEPLKVINISKTGYVEYIDSNRKPGTTHMDWLMPYQNEKKEKVSKYRTTEEGFMTCDDNWLPENRWI